MSSFQKADLGIKTLLYEYELIMKLKSLIDTYWEIKNFGYIRDIFLTQQNAIKNNSSLKIFPNDSNDFSDYENFLLFFFHIGLETDYSAHLGLKIKRQLHDRTYIYEFLWNL